MELNTLIKCKLICDDAAGNFPVPLGDWTPGAVTEISPGAVDLEEYDLFWGAGEKI